MTSRKQTARIAGVLYLVMGLAGAFSIEGLHVSDDTQVALASAPNDITTDFWDGGLTLLLEWTPPGYPIRYWQVTLRLDQTSGVIADAPPLTAWGVCA